MKGLAQRRKSMKKKVAKQLGLAAKDFLWIGGKLYFRTVYSPSSGELRSMKNEILLLPKKEHA